MVVGGLPKKAPPTANEPRRNKPTKTDSPLRPPKKKNNKNELTKSDSQYFSVIKKENATFGKN
jgi:hypothetical protein